MNVNKLLSTWALVVLFLLIGEACSRTVDPTYPDDRGTKLADLAPAIATGRFDRLVDWSADGTELFYLVQLQYAQPNAGNYQLHAVNANTGTSRLVYDDPRWRQLGPFSETGLSRQSPDGKSLYIAAKGNAQPWYYLYRINARQTNQAVVVDSSTDQRYQYTPSVLLSADGARLSFQYRYDSVRLYDLINNTSVRIKSKQTIAFSPDARQVLLAQENGASWLNRNVSLSDLSETILDTKVAVSQSATVSFPGVDHVRWHLEGIRYLYTDVYQNGPGNGKTSLHLLLWNVQQQKRTELWSVPDEEVGIAHTTWARNGQRVAFSSTNEAQALQEKHPNYILYTTELASLKTRNVATITLREEEGNQQLGQLVIAPDNSKIAYTLGSTVYVVSL